MKIVTFNVNGIRSFEKYLVAKGSSLASFLDSLAADIVCFQETKVNLSEAVTLESTNITHPSGYDSLYSYNSAKNAIGYSGVATYWKQHSLEPPSQQRDWRPTSHQCGFSQHSNGNLLTKYPELNSGALFTASQSDIKTSLRKLDSEGRCLITDHSYFILMNIYFPLGSSDARTAFKMEYQSIIGQIIELFCTKYGRSVIVAGDINATYDPRDHCDYIDIFRHHGPESSFLQEFYQNSNRIWFKDMVCTTRAMIENDSSKEPSLLVDTLRFNEPDCEARYSCWNTRIGARASNYGTRIDYILLDRLTVKKWYDMHGRNENQTLPFECVIRSEIRGSDHCPVACTFIDSLFDNSKMSENGDENVTSVKKKQHVSTRLDQYFSPTRKLPETDKSVPLDPSSRLIPTRSTGLKRKKLEDFFKPSADVTRLDVIDSDAIKLDVAESDLSSANTETNSLLHKTSSLANTMLDPQWHQIFHGSKKPAPICKVHGEPCTLFTVNKKGKNQGRKFYLCSRPVGASTDPATRCNFFQWTR